MLQKLATFTCALLAVFCLCFLTIFLLNLNLGLTDFYLKVVFIVGVFVLDTLALIFTIFSKNEDWMKC